MSMLPEDAPLGPVQVLHRETLYRGFFHLERVVFEHALFAGGMSGPVTRELLHRGHAVVVLPYDPVRDEVVLLQQIRVGALETAQPWMWELVAGVQETGEDEAGVAAREMQEEAGLQLLALEPITTYLNSAGGCTERTSVYCGHVRGAQAGIHGLPEEHEDIRTVVLPFDEAWAWLQAGRIRAAAAIIGLQWLKLERARLRQQWSA